MPGCAPGRAPSFLVTPRKEGKRRRPCCLRPSASLRATCGARSRGAPWNSLCACSAPLRQPRRASSRSGCVLRHTRHPAPCAPRRIQKGLGAAQQPHGPSLRSAWVAQTPRRRLAPERSAGAADCGARFFASSLVARQERRSPAGPNPGLCPPQSPDIHNQNDSVQRLPDKP